jgi:hypothetical protein
MKVNTFGRLALTAGIMAVAASGLVATPAYADPATLYADNLVGFGSDTTQDVMQELSSDIGVDKLASFNSTFLSPATAAVQARPGGPSNVVRAKGSGDGLKMLQVAEGTLTQSTSVSILPSGTATANKANTVGQIDYSRSSSAGTTQSNTGEYVYIPFARDVVGIAVDSADAVSKIPLTFGSSTDSATTPSINAIFRCKARYVYTDANNAYVGVGATDTLPAGATTASIITPLVPAFGSGTATFFIKAATGQTDAAAFPAAASGFECIKRVKLDGTTPIQEHDGSSVSELTNSMGIYSIGQYVAQKKTLITGVTDKTSGTSLMAVNGVEATTGAGDTLAPNADNWESALKRFVYNVVAYRKAADTSSKIHEMFVGTDSLVCTNTDSISKMGFAPLGASDGGDPTSNANSCGSIAPANRYTMGSDGVSMTTAPTVTNVAAVGALTPAVGQAFTVAVRGGVATHDMGGTVQILDAPYGTSGANVLGSQTIGEGSDIAANVAVTPLRAVSTRLYAVFIPKLGAIKVTPMSPVSADDKSFATIVPSNPSTTKLTIRKPAFVGGSVRVVAWIDAADTTASGTITLYKNSVDPANQLAFEDVEAGETAAVLGYVQAVASQTIVAKFVSTNTSETSTSSTKTVVLTKSTPTIAFGALPAAPNGFVASGNNYAIAKTINFTKSATVNATTDVVTATAHGFAANTAVYFTGAPGGVTNATTKYYVMATGLTADAFKVSATKVGTTALNFTTAGVSVKVRAVPDTISTATTGNTAGVITMPSNGLVVNDQVSFSGTTLPAGVTANTWYFVKAVTPASATFTISNTQGGALKTFTGAGTGVVITKRNALPKIAVTVTGPSGVTLKPSGSVKVFVGTTQSDTTREITTATGLTLSNGAATVTLTAADLWTWISTPTSAGATAYLIVKYEGDDAFNGATNVVKTLTVTP